MVIYHVEHDAQPSLVQRGHGAAQFENAGAAVARVGAVRPHRRVVVHGVVAPVERVVILVVQPGLIYGGVLGAGQQMHVRDAEVGDVVGAYSHAARVGQLFGERAEAALCRRVRFARKVADVHFPYNGVGITFQRVSFFVFCVFALPALRRDGRRREVRHHAAAAVQPRGKRVRVAQLGVLAAVVRHRISIIHAFEVGVYLRRPYPARRARHALAEQVGRTVARREEIEPHVERERRPQPERRFSFLHFGAERAVVIISFVEFGSVVYAEGLRRDERAVMRHEARRFGVQPRSQHDAHFLRVVRAARHSGHGKTDAVRIHFESAVLSVGKTDYFVIVLYERFRFHRAYPLTMTVTLAVTSGCSLTATL